MCRTARHVAGELPGRRLASLAPALGQETPGAKVARLLARRDAGAGGLCLEALKCLQLILERGVRGEAGPVGHERLQKVVQLLDLIRVGLLSL